VSSFSANTDSEVKQIGTGRLKLHVVTRPQYSVHTTIPLGLGWVLRILGRAKGLSTDDDVTGP
jgi:hypothetical protein